jgi:tRNA(Ile)-lysidine synthase
VQVTLPTGNGVKAFADAITRLTGAKSSKLLLAVSGGPDSLALLLLAAAAMTDHICAATVDHGLRPEAKAEADYVAVLCALLNVPHHILRPEEPITGNLQSNARAARYALLNAHADQQNCEWIATAHHADDQLETLLMRIARGSGIDGLAAIRKKQGKIIRPLLQHKKQDFEEMCQNAGVVPTRDPSNDDASFDRVAMRQWLASTRHPFDTARAVRTTSALADASEALDWVTEREFASRVSADTKGYSLQPDALPLELQRRLVRRVLADIETGNNPRGEAMDRALIDLATGKRFTLGNILCQGGDIWTFRLAPPRKK